MEEAARPADAFGEAHFRRQHVDGLELILARDGVQSVAVGVDEHERAAHVRMVRPGDERNLVRAWDRLRLEAGVDSLRVVAKHDARVRSIGIAGPEPVVVRSRAVHVVPSGVDDAAVGQDRRVPLVGLVEGERSHVPAGRVHPVQRVRRQGLPRIVTPPEPAATRGHEGDPAVPAGARIEIVVAALGELPQIRAVCVHRPDVEAPSLGRVIVGLGLSPLGEAEVERAGVVGHRERRIVALRQPVLDEVADLERVPGRSRMYTPPPAMSS